MQQKEGDDVASITEGGNEDGEALRGVRGIENRAHEVTTTVHGDEEEGQGSAGLS